MHAITLPNNVHLSMRNTTVTSAQLSTNIWPLCIGDRVTFTCTVQGEWHAWSFSLPQLSNDSIVVSPAVGDFNVGPFSLSAQAGKYAGAFNSTATVEVFTELNGTTIACRSVLSALHDAPQQIVVNVLGEFPRLIYNF